MNLKLILIVCFLSLFSNFGKAQSNDEQEAKKRILELKKTLNLTPEQLEEVKKVFSESKQTRQSLREKLEKAKNDTPEKKQIIISEIKSFKEEQKAKITQLLTEEQIKKFQEMIQIKKFNDSYNNTKKQIRK